MFLQSKYENISSIDDCKKDADEMQIYEIRDFSIKSRKCFIICINDRQLHFYTNVRRTRQSIQLLRQSQTIAHNTFITYVN